MSACGCVVSRETELRQGRAELLYGCTAWHLSCLIGPLSVSCLWWEEIGEFSIESRCYKSKLAAVSLVFFSLCHRREVWCMEALVLRTQAERLLLPEQGSELGLAAEVYLHHRTCSEHVAC